MREFIVTVKPASSPEVPGLLWHVQWPNDTLPLGVWIRKDDYDSSVGAAVASLLPVIGWSLDASKLSMSVIDGHSCRVKLEE